MRGSSKLHAMLASMMAFAGFPYVNEMPGSGRMPRKFGRIRGSSGNRYKSCFSCGFRGFPRRAQPNGAKAPTIDQVRRLERKYGQRLIVVRGLIWFRDKVPFSHEEAERRQAHAVPDPA